MSFADAYLLKAGLRGALVEPEPHPGLDIIVTIPVYRESGLERCLDSLFICGCGSGAVNAPSGSREEPGPGIRAEVLILINAPADAPPEIKEHNQATLAATKAWISEHPHPCMDFHVWLDHSFGKKEAGVGLARKILMDEAVRRFGLLDRPEGIIASMDADAQVQDNYLEALAKHFHAGPDGCSIRFEHPLSGTLDPAVYGAIIQYELHLRYYLQSVRFTGYPHAFHTVGSSFAVRAHIYCKEGGMNRRQGGEDFYFIQKVAQRGNFSQCNATCIYPSPRPSDRVPFGTGPVVSRLSKGERPLLSYDPRPFGMLRTLFQALSQTEAMAGPWPEPLQSFLETQDFKGALEEMKANSASDPAFRKRFWRWFSMFRIMKFLHFARENGYPDIPVGDSAAALLRNVP